MNGKINILKNRRGTLFLALMVMIAVAGIIATKLLPSRGIQVKREQAYELRMTLGQIRQAVDLKHLASPTYAPNFNSSDSIRIELKKLSDQHYLRVASLTDNTIPHYLWASDKLHYWRGTSNKVENTSFEDMESDGKIASWVLITGTDAASTSNYLDSSQIDSYPDQNKLGKAFRASGTALVITK